MLFKFSMWGSVPLFWLSPLVLQQGQHSSTCHSYFYRGKEALTIQVTLTGFGGSSLLQDGCMFHAWMHLQPQHSSGSKQWPRFIAWELNARENKDQSNLGKRVGSRISARLLQLPLSWPQLNTHMSLILCWGPAHTVQHPETGVGPEQQRSFCVTKEETMGRVRKKKDLFSVTISDYFFSEVLTKKFLLGCTFPFVFLIAIIDLKHIVVDGQRVFSADL